LKALFRDLTLRTRMRIEQLWNAKALELEEMWVVMERTTGTRVPRDLPTALDVSSRGFTEMRYLHEDDTGTFLVGDLAPILRTVILEQLPGWAAYRHGPPTSLSRGTPAPPAKSPLTPQDGSQ